MIRNREKTSEVERLRQVDRQTASRRLVAHDRQIARIEEPEERFQIPSSPSSVMIASRMGFITDWADS